MNAVFFATLRAIAFLSRLPLPARAFRDGGRLADDAGAFALAGAIVALPAAVVLWAAVSVGLTPMLGAVLAVTAGVMVTGGLHEDGLADTADGLGAGADRTRALAIMKDSRIGAYGTLALILSLALRIALVADLAGHSPALAALALVGTGAASRGAMAWLWASLPAATPGGVADREGRPSRQAGRVAAATGALGLTLLGAPLAGWAMLLAPVLAATAALSVRRALRRRLGGRTGDTLGALQQIVEIAALLGLAIAAG